MGNAPRTLTTVGATTGGNAVCGAPLRRSPDHLILTAGDERQASAFRHELESRRRDGRIPAGTHTHVVTDPCGRRVGSGGSTLAAFYHLAQTLPGARSLAARLAGRRVFILHAGGLASRLPAYAAAGKPFTPVPYVTARGLPATVFDLALAALQELPAPPGGHVLVGSGDVLLRFDPATIDLSRPGITGLAFRAGPTTAARHGVYVLGPNRRVDDFLQKPDAAELRRQGGLDTTGRASVDTGLLSFDPAAVQALCTAAGLAGTAGAVTGPGLLADLLAGRTGEIDLYLEITTALARSVTPEVFEARVLALPKNTDPAQRERLRALYQGVHGLPFHAQVLPRCAFFHAGTSRELLAGFTDRRRAAVHGFRDRVGSVVPSDWEGERTVVLNSLVETGRVRCGGAVLLEGSHVRCPLELAGDNIITGLPGEARHAVRLPQGVGLLMLPVGRRRGWAAVLYGLDDVPEQSFLHAPLERFLESHGLTPEVVWPEGGRCPADARLWCVGRPDYVLAHTLWMVEPAPDADRVAAWLRRRRKSFTELLAAVDHRRLRARRAEVARLAAIHAPWERLAEAPELDAAALAQAARGRGRAAAMMAALARGLKDQPEPLQRARGLVLGMLLRRHADGLPPHGPAGQHLDRASRTLVGGAGTADAMGRAAAAEVARVVATGVGAPAVAGTAAVRAGYVVQATAPARLDFAGGWSDTPPVCHALGGAVVNAAVTLDGMRPVEVTARLTDDYRLRVRSLDLARERTIVRAEELAESLDPSDWSALPRACLWLAGLTGGQSRGDLSPFLRGVGGGVDLTLRSAVPRGSGLGTSSILGAATLACLARLTGERLSLRQLIARTLLLEQRMTTGGGWQDQAGGLLPGVKFLWTRPGLKQSPTAVPLAWPEGFLRGRLLLYYTGVSRLAKDILQDVVLGFLAQDPRVLDVLKRLKAGALAVRDAIERGDEESFAEGLAQYWELKKELTPSATNARVESLIARVRPFCSGHTLTGAGGGGFLLLVARSVRDATRLRAELAHAPAVAGARFFDFDWNDQGLDVRVLREGQSLHPA